MLTDQEQKVSADRLQRFVTPMDAGTGQDADGNIFPGDFVLMKVADDEKVCRVLSFKYANSKYKFKARSCPTNKPDIEILVQSFDQRDSKLIADNVCAKFIDINLYIKHLTVIRKDSCYVISQ